MQLIQNNHTLLIITCSTQRKSLCVTSVYDACWKSVSRSGYAGQRPARCNSDAHHYNIFSDSSEFRMLKPLLNLGEELFDELRKTVECLMPAVVNVVMKTVSFLLEIFSRYSINQIDSLEIIIGMI